MPTHLDRTLAATLRRVCASFPVEKTAKAWLSVLETSGLVYLLPPWHSNLTKRLVKTAKLYFLDSGLCAYLTRWTSAESLEAGAMSGAILETYVLAEVLKGYWHNGRTPNLHFHQRRPRSDAEMIRTPGRF